MRDLRACSPIPATVVEGGNLDAPDFSPKVECSQHRCQASEGIAQSPVLVSQVDSHAVTPLWVLSNWSGERNRDSALLVVPAHERLYVGRRPADVVITGISGLIS